MCPYSFPFCLTVNKSFASAIDLFIYDWSDFLCDSVFPSTDFISLWLVRFPLTHLCSLQLVSFPVTGPFSLYYQLFQFVVPTVFCAYCSFITVPNVTNLNNDVMTSTWLIDTDFKYRNYD